jgi:hypothetical protein
VKATVVTDGVRGDGGVTKVSVTVAVAFSVPLATVGTVPAVVKLMVLVLLAKFVQGAAVEAVTVNVMLWTAPVTGLVSV